MFASRPSNFERKSFFDQISSSLSLFVNQYENITVASDLNITLLDPLSNPKYHLSALGDTFAFTNLVQDKTYFKNKNDTLLDFVL